jgi:hypothetical protein
LGVPVGLRWILEYSFLLECLYTSIRDCVDNLGTAAAFGKLGTEAVKVPGVKELMKAAQDALVLPSARTWTCSEVRRRKRSRRQEQDLPAQTHLGLLFLAGVYPLIGSLLHPADSDTGDTMMLSLTLGG